MRLLEGFTRCPDRVAFTIGDAVLTYSELDQRSSAYAAGLAERGVSSGDRVAVQSGSSIELIIALIGHLRSGIIHVPINTRYLGEEIAHILTDSGASMVLFDAEAKAEGFTSAEARGVELRAKQAAQKAKEAEAAAAAAKAAAKAK